MEAKAETGTSDIAIIGAGMAGLACATRLAAAGLRPVLFDKGRGPGGRMATRRAEVHGETVRFDHGAQYFTVRDAGFKNAVAGWKDAGVVADWPAASDDAVIGAPSMNAPIHHMADALDVRWATRVDSIESTQEDWLLHIGARQHLFHKAIIAVPAEQAAILLAGHQDGWASRAEASTSKPCWAVMAVFGNRLPLGDTFRGNTVSWAARNSAKPGRGGGEHWVIHASPEWSAANIEAGQADAASAILSAFVSETGIATQEPLHLAAHRWRFAMADPAPGAPHVWDAGAGLGACGDWLSGPRVENAWISGDGLAKAVLG